MNGTDPTDICAACGKEGDSLKSCAACRLVKYCNVTCQKAHRPKHKKECRRRAAKLNDEELFKDTPKEDCPVCFLPMPLEEGEKTHQPCCGKVVCSGCIYGVHERVREEKDPKLGFCPFCRTPPPRSYEEALKRYKKRMECGDGHAFNTVGHFHKHGSHGMPIDKNKAIEMWIRAGELGCATGYRNGGIEFQVGVRDEVDMNKAMKYYELAAKLGDAQARHNLGCFENDAGNINRAIKHLMIAARAGYNKSLDAIKKYYIAGNVSKDELEKTLRAYQKSNDDMKSDMRSKAKNMSEHSFTIGGMEYKAGNLN